MMGMERLVETVDEAAAVLEVLARSGTGQRLSVYTTMLTGPRRAGDPDGPDELHVVILDNGRSRVLGSNVAEVLACIRCGACLNVCPVYRRVGGHSYGSVYGGPVGAVLTPALEGPEQWADLPYASTLCGACREVCPVGIDLPGLLLASRANTAFAAGSSQGFAEPCAPMRPSPPVPEHGASPSPPPVRRRAFSRARGGSSRSRGTGRRGPTAATCHDPRPAASGRDGRSGGVERERFLAAVAANVTAGVLPAPPPITTGPPSLPDVDLIETFCTRLGVIGGHAHRCAIGEAVRQVLDLLGEHAATAVLAWDDLPVPRLASLLQESGVELLASSMPADRGERAAHLGGYLGLAAGLTGADAGLAESGSVVLSHGPGRPRLASLAPEVHIALLPAEPNRPLACPFPRRRPGGGRSDRQPRGDHRAEPHCRHRAAPHYRGAWPQAHPCRRAR